LLSIIEAAGWPIYPLLLCSVIALAIIGFFIAAFAGWIDITPA